MNVKRIAKISIVAGGIVFVLIQFIQPNRVNPQSDPAQSMSVQMNMPSSIKSLLDRGCRDCHSNETVWPIYSYVAPASWLVAYDVNEGRKYFNMSEWGTYKFSKKVQKLSGIYEAVSSKSMPMPKYIPLHPEANFSDAERDTLSRWAQKEAEKMMGGEDE